MLSCAVLRVVAVGPWTNSTLIFLVIETLSSRAKELVLDIFRLGLEGCICDRIIVMTRTWY